MLKDARAALLAASLTAGVAGVALAQNAPGLSSPGTTGIANPPGTATGNLPTTGTTPGTTPDTTGTMPGTVTGTGALPGTVRAPTQVGPSAIPGAVSPTNPNAASRPNAAAPNIGGAPLVTRPGTVPCGSGSMSSDTVAGVPRIDSSVRGC